MENLYFTSFDNNKLFYRKWNFEQGKKTLILIHRGHEHSERLNSLAQDEKFLKYNIFAYDLRGHGYTETKTSPNAMDYVRDLDAFVKHIKNEYQIKEEDIFIVANSIGGVILSAYVHDFAPNLAGIALLAPAFEIKLYVPFAKQLVTLLTKIKKDAKVMSYVKAKVLTHDVEEQNKYNSDKLINKEINARLLIDLVNMGQRLIEDSMAIELPTIIFSAQKDYVVKNSAQKKFYLSLSSKKREFIELENFYHGIIFEKERQTVYKMLDDFIQDVFKNQKIELDDSPREFSRKEYERIGLEEYPLSEKIYYSIQKFSMKTFGFLSKGMSLGLKYGFDSGISLDYIYKNQANGKLLIGKLIDRFYLNQVGWAGVRVRKKNLLALIEEKINSLGEENVKILDVAGGTGNYLFDIKEKYPKLKILINEFKKSNIEVGEEVIKKNNWQDISFINYDCFDKETYKKINYSPNIVIISGVFELFEDNKMLENTISGITEILDKDAAVIYTGQPWHPQLKQIALVLNSHKGSGKSWLMRRRSEKELDSLFEKYNLKKKKMLIDNEGIFTVSLAEMR
ncbi:alpha/beta fold hydrolase [Fusobacterium periodonticum]|uniref:bifunctional alpha/beta hydrolase/class I SAM-dependent methyltransferase n=1 Tax=Fusobacterium periodonticum TaxID=860 RepID=UPI00352CA2E6